MAIIWTDEECTHQLEVWAGGIEIDEEGKRLIKTFQSIRRLGVTGTFTEETRFALKWLW